MKAMMIKDWGKPKDLQLLELPDPQPQAARPEPLSPPPAVDKVAPCCILRLRSARGSRALTGPSNI